MSAHPRMTMAERRLMRWRRAETKAERLERVAAEMRARYATRYSQAARQAWARRQEAQT